MRRFPLLMPILDPAYVADSIVHAVRTNTAVLVLPRFCYLAPLLRFLLPTRLFDAAAVRAQAFFCCKKKTNTVAAARFTD